MRKQSFLLALLVLFSALAFGCGSKPAKNVKKEAPAAAPKTTASPKATVPPISDGVPIEKVEKLSFSTYSHDWPDGWQFIDPDENADSTKYDVKTGVLRMVVPSGKDLHGDNMTAPRYVKAIKGDFQIDTKVRATPSENYQGAGLLIFNDAKNYVRLERAFGGTGGGGSGIRFDMRNGDEYTSIKTPDDIAFDGAEVELRLIKNSGKITAYWRADENAEWREVGEADFNNAETVLTGLIACNTAREFEVKFVDMTLSPIAQTK